MADKAKIAEVALARFKRATEAWADQREREDDALRFQVPEMQWDDAVRNERLGLSNAVPTPGRPVLSIPKLDQPISIVLTQQRSAHLGVEIHPVTEDATDDTAEMIQDKYREIERDSNAHIARSWAFERAVKAGMGFYYIGTKTDPYGGHKSDKKITIERILDARTVLLDPDAQEADFADGNFAFIRVAMRESRFKEKFPKAELPGTDRLEFADAMASSGGFIEGDSSDPVYVVADYWYKDYNDDGETWTLMYCRLAPGGEPLQFLDGPREVDGCWIPIVPVVGRELVPFEDDGSRRWQGMIEPAMDAQRLFNYAASAAVEMASLEPKAPFIGTLKQFETLEDLWKQANTRNLPYLPYNSDPAAPGPPQRSQVDAGRLGPSMQLLQEADSFIQASTAVYNPSLGRPSNSQESGKKVQALQEQATAATSSYLQNMADIAMVCEARIILDKLYPTYDRAGRVVRTLDAEGESGTAMLNTPYYKHPETGKLTALPDGGVAPPNVKIMHHDLSRGRFMPSITVGKAYQTRVAQASEAISQLMQALPPAVQVAVLPAWLKVQDFPGHSALADTMQKIRDHEMPFLAAGGDQSDPKQLQAQAQALQQQNQTLQQQLQQAAKMLEMEHAKHQAQVTIAQIKAQSDQSINDQNNATKLAIARITAAKEAFDAQREDQEERLALGVNLTHETNQAAMDRAHEVHMSDRQAQAAQQQQAMDGAQDAQSQAADQAHEGQMQAGDQAHEAGMAQFGAANDQQMQAADHQAAADQAAQAQADGAGE